MSKFDYTAKAKADLEEIIDYTIEQWDINQALKYLDIMEEQLQLLAENPSIGKNREDLQSGLLSFPYESHILYYLATSKGITIIRILHKNRDAFRHF